MSNSEARKTLYYLLALVVLIFIFFFVLAQLGDGGLNSFGFGNNSGKYYGNPPEFTLEESRDYKATLKTNKGDIKIDLLEKNAPITVNNFVFLANEDFYNNQKFHRVVRDFIIQAGSPLSTDQDSTNDGIGGPGYKFADEINWQDLELPAEQRETLKNDGYTSDADVNSIRLSKYAVAMANAGPDTNGSQFFIVTGESDNENIENLQGRHTVFGIVIEGQEVVDAINNADVDDLSALTPLPLQDIIIEDIVIE